MAEPVLVIRADASAAVGWGHVLRCLALAQAWQDAGGAVVFACAELPRELEARLQAESCVVHRLKAAIGSVDDAAQTRNLVQRYGASWLVCDGYKFDGDFLRALQSGEFALMALDDFSETNLGATDVILNSNAGAAAEFYAHSAPEKRVLAGKEFALLRREFRLRAHSSKPISENVKHVLITMGGTDPAALTPRALRWLQDRSFKGEVVVLCGALSDKPISESFDFRVQFVSAENDVPRWMEWCDVALAAAGSTTWELACCGVPAILSVIAPNQRRLARWCEENGVARSVGEADDFWEARLESAWENLQKVAARQEMSARAQQAIDGQGAACVVRELWPSALFLRPVTINDARILWEWRNDHRTRAMSLQSDFVEWQTHLNWLQNRLCDPQNLLWIAQRENETVGHVRFERQGVAAIISIVVAPAWRGRGVGSELIRAACRVLWRVWDVARVEATIKAENRASQHAFRSAGFQEQPDDASALLTLILERAQ